MKVKNASKSVVRIRGKIIKPGEIVELTSEEAEFSGVQALIKKGILKEVREKKDKKSK